MKRILYCLIYVPFYLFSLLPLRLHYCISSFISFVLSKIFHYRYGVVNINIARSFPDLKYKAVKDIASGFYEYMSDVMVEALWAYTASPEKITRLQKVSNPEVLSEIVAAHGKAIVVMAHKGNWELIGGLAGNPDTRPASHYGNTDFVIAYRKLANPVMDRLMYTIRHAGFKKFRNGGDIVESAELFRYMVRNRDKNKIYFMIADQSSSRSKLIADFLHQKTCVFNGPEYLATKMDIPVVYLSSSRSKRGEYVVEYKVIAERPAETARGEITAKYMKMLEEDIKSEPYSWLWSHKRWKKKIKDGDEGLIFI